MLEQNLPAMSLCSNPDVPATAAPEQNMGDFIQAFTAFVGNGPDEDPLIRDGQSAVKNDQKPLDNVTDRPPDESGLIVESIIDELLATPFMESTNAVESILDEIISNVPLLAIVTPSSSPSLSITLTPVVAPPPRLPATPVRVVRGKVQPPTQPPPDRPGRMTNQLLYIKRKVMPAIWAHKFTWPFKKPVDAIKLGIPDYHTIIKQPMDFGTVRKRLTQKYYWSASECQDDIRLVFWNCFTYNKPELDISIMGRTLEKEVESLLKRMPAEEVGEEDMKAAVKRKGRPPGGERRRSQYSNDGDHVSKKARTLADGSFDFESDIPVAQAGAYAPVVKSTNKRRGYSSDESDTEDDEESGSGSEFDELETGRAPGARPSNHRPVPVPRTFQDEKPGGLLTERKTIKNYCKYCDQAFLSKYVRDMHEKVKHGSGYVSAEKPKKMPVIKKPKKEPKSLQIMPIKTEASESPPVQNFGEQSATNATAQFSDHDLLNFVDKKHQAMNKQAKKNQSKPGVKDPAEHQNNIRIPDDMLFPVPEELLLKQGYMHNSSAPPPSYPHGNGSVNGLDQPTLSGNPIRMVSKPAAPNLQIPTPVAGAKVGARAPRPARGGKAPALAKPQQSLNQQPLALASPTADSKYDLQKELGFMEPTFTKSALVTPAGQQPRVVAPSTIQQQQQVYLGHPNGPPPVVRHQVRSQRPTMQPSNNGPSHEALMMARNAMRHQQAGIVRQQQAGLVHQQQQRSPIVINSQNNSGSLASYSSPTPQHVQQRSTSLGYEGLRSPEMQQLAPSPQSVHRGSIEERSPGPFLPQQQKQQQQRPAVIQENSYRPTLAAAVLNKPSTSQSIINARSASYTSPPPVQVAPQQQAPRPIALESRSVIFPSKPLPKEELKQVQVMQGTPTVPSFTSRPTPTTKPADDLLAQTLQLSEIDGFDFTEEKDMPNLVSTQEITLGDLKHLRTETVSIPGAQVLRGQQVKQLPIVTNGGDQKLEDLLDFSNITYQDVRQLIGPTENMIVYPEADGSYSEVIATGSQQTVMLQAQPIAASSRPVAQQAGQQPQAITFSSTQSFTLQSNASLTTSTSMPTFTTDLVYPDIGSAALEAGTVYATIPEQKRDKREEKWWA